MPCFISDRYIIIELPLDDSNKFLKATLLSGSKNIIVEFLSFPLNGPRIRNVPVDYLKEALNQISRTLIEIIDLNL